MAFATAKNFPKSSNKSRYIIVNSKINPEKPLVGDFERFVADIIHGFTSKDADVRREAVLKANHLMKEEEESETIKPVYHADEKDVKTDAESPVIVNHPPNAGHGDETIRVLNVVDFIKDLSMDDIDTRKLTRPERKRKSDELRKLGNLSFAQKKFSVAVEFYSKAIDLIRDSGLLYTNRSFAYIKLGCYDLAVKDCDKAIFIAEYSLTARLYKAQALFLLGEIAHCLTCLQETRQILPFHQSAIDHCENNLLGTLPSPAQGEAKNDTFSTEKFMRLAARFDVKQMESFFPTNGYI